MASHKNISSSRLLTLAHMGYRICATLQQQPASSSLGIWCHKRAHFRHQHELLTFQRYANYPSSQRQLFFLHGGHPETTHWYLKPAIFFQFLVKRNSCHDTLTQVRGFRYVAIFSCKFACLVGGTFRNHLDVMVGLNTDDRRIIPKQ